MIPCNKLNHSAQLFDINNLEATQTLSQLFNSVGFTFMRYIVNNKIYSGEASISSLNLPQEADHVLIRQTVPVFGGKKKKDSKGAGAQKGSGQKKKTPKKILKYFKLTGKGVDTKVEYLKTDCKGLDCGIGYGFAAHKDKNICGKCGRVSKAKKTTK